MEKEELSKRTIRSVVALTSRTIFLQTVSFGAFFLLGMFLSPSAIGVFITVSALMRIFSLFTDLGLGAALIQKKEDISHDDLKTTFTIQEILVVSVVIFGLLLTPIVTRLVSLDTNGVFLYQVLIVTLFISSLKTIPSILLERKLAFEIQVIPQIVEAIIFNCLVVVLAYKGLEVAAYSWSILLSSLVGLPIYYLVSPWKISLGVVKNRAKELLSYGLAYQAKNFLSVLKDDLLIVFLNTRLTPASIGYWGWAQRWSYSPFRLLVDSITKVTFPAYSRIQHDKILLRIGIEKSIFAVSLVLFPVLTMMGVLVREAVSLIPRYSKWEPALASFYLLAATAAISGISNILINALDATGRVKISLVMMLIWIVLTWLLTIVLVANFGFTGIAAASFLVALTIILTIYLVQRIVKFNLIGNILPAILGSILAGTIMVIFQINTPTSFLTLVTTATIGAIIYLLTIWLLARSKITTSIKTLISVYRK